MYIPNNPHISCQSLLNFYFSEKQHSSLLQPIKYQNSWGGFSPGSHTFSGTVLYLLLSAFSPYGEILGAVLVQEVFLREYISVLLTYLIILFGQVVFPCLFYNSSLWNMKELWIYSTSARSISHPQIPHRRANFSRDPMAQGIIQL